MKSPHPRFTHSATADVVTTRRTTSRFPASFGLMYAGLTEDGEVVIGDGAVVDLSRAGLGIRGNEPVPLRMDLTLFLYLPDGEDPLCIVQGRVVWSEGRRFGVKFAKLSLQDGRRLQALISAGPAPH